MKHNTPYIAYCIFTLYFSVRYFHFRSPLLLCRVPQNLPPAPSVTYFLRIYAKSLRPTKAAAASSNRGLLLFTGATSMCLLSLLLALCCHRLQEIFNDKSSFARETGRPSHDV
jgi:hypothetical protein